MALDESLLESCLSGGRGFPCLRIYSFRPACLSLGAFQPWRGSVDPSFCREHAIEIVRRPTGGQAVLHDEELTYAVIARLGDPPFGTRVRCNYDAISRALSAAFASLGVDAVAGAGASPRAPDDPVAACFARTSGHELASGRWKIAGSAQVRRRGAFLQHGSLPLRMDPLLLAGATGTAPGAGAPPDVRGISAIAGREITGSELSDAIVAAFGDALDAELHEAPATTAESVRAEWLRGHKYLTTSWTLRR
jgi:lipoate-protein ligase A